MGEIPDDVGTAGGIMRSATQEGGIKRGLTTTMVIGVCMREWAWECERTY